MLKMKYIIRAGGHGLPCPVMFGDTENHNDIAYRLGGEIISAGFVDLGDNGVQCYGESISLNIRSRPEIDSKIINVFFGIGEW